MSSDIPKGCWGRVFKEIDPEVAKRQKEEEERRQNVHEMFVACDADGSGTIERSELKPLLVSLGFSLSDEQLEGVLEEMRFHSGDREELDFEGFMSLVEAQNSVRDLEMKQVWPMFDHDGDGKLTFEEVEAALIQIGISVEEEDMKRMWDAADLNNDGSITFDEFSQASGDDVWKKTVTMMSIQQNFAKRMMGIADGQKKWMDLLEEREDADFLVERAKIMRRCALRQSPQVKGAIDTLWSVFDGIRVATSPTGDHRLISKKVFLTYFLKMAKTILKDEFDKEEMMEMSEEEWVRQTERYKTKEAEAGNSAPADGVIDYEVFYESMFELLDYEGERFIQASTYAGFAHGLVNQLVVEKISNGTKKWQKGLEVTARDRLGRNWAWLKPEEFNFTELKDWESIDRVAEQELNKEEAMTTEAKKAKEAQMAKEDGKAFGQRSAARAVAARPVANPLAIFNKMDVNGDGVLDIDEITEALSDFGLMDGAIERLVMHMDTNNDGVIQQSEFIEGYGRWLDTTTGRLNCNVGGMIKGHASP